MDSIQHAHLATVAAQYLESVMLAFLDYPLHTLRGTLTTSF